MSVSAVNTTNPTDPNASAGATTGLTPDAFFAYCEAQMSGIDLEASGYFDQQQSSNLAKQTLNTIIGQLQANSQGINDTTAVATIAQELATLKVQYPQASQQIDNMIYQINNDPSGTAGVVNSNIVQQLVSQLNDLSTQMDSANQLSMIKLQSAMSAREQVLQLTSNILEAVDSGDSKVIGNIHS